MNRSQVGLKKKERSGFIQNAVFIIIKYSAVQ